MSTPQSHTGAPDPTIVYIRKVAVADLPEDLQRQAGELDELYAIGNEAGERIALVKDRELAFTLARQNDLRPVSAH